MEKKSYHHKNLKHDLIEKGIEMVNKEGLEQLSLRKVAMACGVSHAAPYSHFSGKEELMEAMQNHITEQFVKVLDEKVMSYQGKEAFLKEFGKAYFHFFLENPHYFHFLYQQGNMQVDLRAGEHSENAYKPFEIYREQVLGLLEKARLTEVQKQSCVISLFAYMHGLTSLATMKNALYEHAWEEKIDGLLDLFVLRV